ncbi:hypothetical protein BG005_005864 [Podila minutissima]|nr:hypothetical protein BG005_005864 [Podila minutissima]
MITAQSQPDFARAQKFFSHCILEELVVKCHLIDPDMSDPVAKIQLLAYVSNEDPPDPGDKSVQQEVSHESILFIERLVGKSSLMKLYFKDVLLQDQRDWITLIESMSHLLENFHMADISFEHVMSIPKTEETRISKMAD